MATKTINMTDQLHQYMLDCSLREDPVLTELRKVTADMPKSEMQISPEQGQFMAFLVKMLDAKKTLDVGVFTGYSSLVVALCLPKNGKVIACDVDEGFTNVAKEFWAKANVQDKIDLHLAPAAETLQKLIDAGEAGTFDFAFIDADKVGYPDYYEKSLKLLRPGGVIAFDNMFRHGDIANPDNADSQCVAIRALQKTILTDDRVDESLVPISDGLMLVRKR